jgi:hypothetical protein
MEEAVVGRRPGSMRIIDTPTPFPPGFGTGSPPVPGVGWAGLTIAVDACGDYHSLRVSFVMSQEYYKLGPC